MAKQVSGKRALAKIVDETSRPVYLVDVTRRILYCNQACLGWLNVSESDVVGKTCRYCAAMSEAMSPWDGLSPPPQAFATEASQGTIWCGTAPRRTYRQANFFRLADEPSVILAIAGGDASPSPPVVEQGAPSRDSEQLHAQLVAYYAANARFTELDPLIGVSPAIQRIRRQVELASSHNAPTILAGPSGCGAERIMGAIAARRRSGRSSYLLPIDCPLVDRELFESVLLPQVKATGVRRLILLLSQVDEIPADVQPLLQELLDNKSYDIETLGTAKSDLLATPQIDKCLRERLAVLTIAVPSLLSRPEDVPLLVQNAVETLNQHGGKSIGGVSPNALDRLVNHPWNRNVDELYELVAEAYARCSTTQIRSIDLPERLRLTADAELHPLNPPESIDLDAYLQQIEKQLLERAMRVAKGNRAQAARLLGIPRVRLLRRLEAAELNVLPEIPFVPDE